MSHDLSYGTLPSRFLVDVRKGPIITIDCGDLPEVPDWLMKELDVTAKDRNVVGPAQEAAATALQNAEKGNKDILCGAAIELPDGTVITGVNSPLMHAASSAVLNALKHMADIPQKLDLLSPGIIESIGHLKRDVLQLKTISLDLEETLIALSIASTINPTAELALSQLKSLRGMEVHMTHIPTPGDEAGLRRLGVNLTCDPQFASSNLFVG